MCFTSPGRACGMADSLSTALPEPPVLMAETMPRFGGEGLPAFRRWVLLQVVYPAEAFEKGIGGRVTMSFVVEKDGRVTSAEAVSSPSPLLTEEVRRVLLASPVWEPGMQDGRPVRVKYTLPVNFVVDTSESVPAEEPDEPCMMPDEMPRFQNGDLDFFRAWAQMQVRYPEELLERRVTGMTVAAFKVGRNGVVSGIRVLKSPDALLSLETIRILQSSPAWTPGMKDGKAVSVILTIPVRFDAGHIREALKKYKDARKE